MNFQKKLWSVVTGGLVLTGATSNVIGVTARGGIDDQVRSVNLRQLPQLNHSGLLGGNDYFEKFDFEDNAWTYKTDAVYYNSHGDPNWKDSAQYDCFISQHTLRGLIYFIHGFKNQGEGVMLWMSRFASGFSYDVKTTTGIFQDTIEHSKLRLKGDRNFWSHFRSHMGKMINFLDQYDTQGWTGPVKVQFFYKWNGFGNLYEVLAARVA